MPDQLPAGYHPSPDEPYMNPTQLEYFRQRLLKWRRELEDEAGQGLAGLRSDTRQRNVEFVERGQEETESDVDIAQEEHYAALINQIDHALARIDQGEYGYCEQTGEPIGLKRLLAQPSATLSLAAQTQRERHEKRLREPA